MDVDWIEVFYVINDYCVIGGVVYDFKFDFFVVGD